MEQITLNIPETNLTRVVIVGAGFGGLELAKNLSRKKFQVVLIDRHNYHQFQPLYYQVAMAGLEPSSIAFPLRKLFQKNKNVHIRVAKFHKVDTVSQTLHTSEGTCNYDKLVLAIGAKTNYYGNKLLEEKTFGMKSLGEALALRNAILNDYEKAILSSTYKDRQKFIDIVIVGGGATGVELAGSLAEMKEYILPKDYSELDHREVDIYLVQSGDKLLNGMSAHASEKAERFLTQLGVKVVLNKRVKSIEGDSKIILDDGSEIEAGKVIWAAGIMGNQVEGLPEEVFTWGNRIKVNRQCMIEGIEGVYAIGDIAYMEEENYSKGHPQVASVAIQQGRHVARNFIKNEQRPFTYKDRGSMATIGRNKAVVDLPFYKFSGFIAWLVWLLVHLAALIGARNKAVVMLNWIWNYITYDQSLRLIIKATRREE